MLTLLIVNILRFNPEITTGALGRDLPAGFALMFPVDLEWFITLELLLLTGLALGFCISAFTRSLDQASLLMFPAMLIQVLLSGLIFKVCLIAWFVFTHWGLRSLCVSLDLHQLFIVAGYATDPILDNLNLTGGDWTLLGFWFLLVVFVLVLLALTCWWQIWPEKTRIPEE